MEFLDEEANRPRVLFQSRPSPSSQPPEPQTLKRLNTPSLYISLSLSTLLFALSLLFLQSEPLKSIAFWSALSLLLGPFSPSSVTGGDIRVGAGRIVEFASRADPAEEDDSKKRNPNRRSRARRNEEPGLSQAPIAVNGSEKVEKVRDLPRSDDEKKRGDGSAAEEEEEEERESEWDEVDVELLKRQLIKTPVGQPRRWEAIAAAFGGRHRVQSVIRKAKSLGENKMSDSDSFARFLKDRKPVDKRVEDEIEGVVGAAESGGATREGGGGESWSSGEDIALLNALKAFPKEAAMRWEKISAAVPGKSKAACMKRVTELKRGFRSSKAS